MKIPHDLIMESIIDEREKLGSRKIYFSNFEICTKITSINVRITERFKSNHEEADTKLVGLVKNADIPNAKIAMERSPSGDIDIMCIFLSQNFQFNIYINNGTGTSRKILDLHSTYSTS